MAIIVQKFGGTSVGDLQRIKEVAAIVAKTKAAGHDVIVVVSAMQGETDRLISLANGITDQVNAREYDALVSTGEQVSASLLSITLNSMGCSSRSFTGAQIKINTDNQNKKAHIVNIDVESLKLALSESCVPVVAGFQGVDNEGNTTTLGRGGSDITAVALTAALQAEECQIYTDVEGVYTTDPHVVAEARCLSQISFAEMMELSGLGAKVLQARAVEFAHKYHVPIRVLSSFNDGFSGTLITDNPNINLEPQVSGIAFDRNQAKLTVLGMPNKSYCQKELLNAIQEAAIDIDMVVDSVPTHEDYIDFSFTVHRDDYKEALGISRIKAKDYSAREVVGDSHIAKLSLVGLGMKSHAGVASKMFSVLGEEGVNIHLITSTEVKISAVIDEKYMELGARTLHSAFGLDQERP